MAVTTVKWWMEPYSTQHVILCDRHPRRRRRRRQINRRRQRRQQSRTTTHAVSTPTCLCFIPKTSLPSAATSIRFQLLQRTEALTFIKCRSIFFVPVQQMRQTDRIQNGRIGTVHNILVVSKRKKRILFNVWMACERMNSIWHTMISTS